MSGAHLPANWRGRLPAVASYYAQQLRDLGKLSVEGWSQGTCPFHTDGSRSLSVHITGERGHWRCSGPCGGGDMVGFHMRLRGLDFKTAVRDLIGLSATA